MEAGSRSRECRVGGSQRNLDHVLLPSTKVFFFFFFSLQGKTSHNKIREREKRREREMENNGVWRRKQEREKPK